MTTRMNWAGSHAYRAADLVAPGSLAELQELIASRPRVRALGTRHSFSDLADTEGVQIDVSGLGGDVEIGDGVVRVPAGWRYGDLAAALVPRGLALANLASLPHIGVAGAVATGTHGSGRRNGSLAAAVRAVELVTGTGEVLRLGPGDPELAGAVVSLGLLGVMTALELEVEPAYELTQVVFEGLTWPRLLDGAAEVLGAAYSVSVFTRWVGEEVGQVWVKDRVDSAAAPTPSIPGATAATEQRHMIAGMPVDNTTAQLGVPGPWHERLPHFRMGFLPSAGEELQSEYLLPWRNAGAALAAVRELGTALQDVLFVSELRTVAADDLWLSGAYGEDALAIHFTWHRDLDRVTPLLHRLEERLLPLGARPHWGKLFGAEAAALAPLYPRWGDFLELAGRMDPQGRFRNAWSARVLGI